LIRFGLDAIAAYKELFTGNLGYFFAVAKAHFHFMGWFVFHQKKSLFVKPTSKNIRGMYNGSILWQYFFKKKRKFSEIVTYK
jgi:hypothetical protein